MTSSATEALYTNSLSHPIKLFTKSSVDTPIALANISKDSFSDDVNWSKVFAPVLIALTSSIETPDDWKAFNANSSKLPVAS